MTQGARRIFILTTGPVRGLGGMERFLQPVDLSGFQEEQGYGVRVFHKPEYAPERWRRAQTKQQARVADGHGTTMGFI